MRISRRIAAVVAGAALAVTGSAVAAAPANAAGPCGSGYKLVGTYAIKQGGTRKGTLEVHYNSGNGKNCALAYGYGSYYDKRNHKYVAIQLSGRTYWDDVDEGQFLYYAGPVFSPVARGKCINVLGFVAEGRRHLHAVHCG